MCFIFPTPCKDAASVHIQERSRELLQKVQSVSASAAPTCMMQVIPDVTAAALPEHSTAECVTEAGEGTGPRASQRELHRLSGMSGCVADLV